ncbi:type 1 glutamine amidotransferase domain-containing protein [Deinococcus sp. VB142]|uniref:Type 1 glutamine amidotransferase domain-containing protein n=1 Tax=Deinococcus sp. VB142 TaxID=3112952 RepID=A0AAU6Q5Z8_9DEIO
MTTPTPSNRILVVMSSAQQIALQGHKMHHTGFFLNEFGVPAKRLTDAGYELVIATPRGNVPAMDQNSDNAMFFKNEEEHEEIKAFVTDLLSHASIQTTEAVAAEGTQGYAALFLPGGHAPMTDLMVDPGLGDLLRRFHATAKPTALICHAPTALLAAQADPEGFQKGMEAGESPTARDFVYQGYRVTVYSNAEEEATEKTFEAPMLYYPADALAQGGADVQNGTAMKPNVVRDRELLTGQNPFSDEPFVTELLEMLGGARA